MSAAPHSGHTDAKQSASTAWRHVYARTHELDGMRRPGYPHHPLGELGYITRSVSALLCHPSSPLDVPPSHHRCSLFTDNHHSLLISPLSSPPLPP
ncbi:hypothetical protein PtB15_1B571 [Puccinia triticina]|nr:hypothetical protein PtB15_1B571 [Puccinia triticina]